MGCRGVLRAARDGFVTDVDRRKGMRRQTQPGRWPWLMLHICGDPRRRPAYAKARQGAADIKVFNLVLGGSFEIQFLAIF